MKKFHNILFIVFLTLLSSNVFAQKSPFTFGVEIGGNLSNNTFDLYESSRSPKLGFRVGGTVEYDITNGFFLQSGLAFTTKGAKHKGKDFRMEGVNPSITLVRTTINQMYLQLPITVAYKVEITPDIKFFMNVGPYIAYGIGGKTTTKNDTKGTEGYREETDKQSTFESKMLKRFDYGLIGGLGVEYSQFIISLNYELGLRDISYKDENPVEKYDYKNRNASLTIGYKF